jgi:hypothetical protein
MPSKYVDSSLLTIPGANDLRTKTSSIYKRTKNLRAVQILLSNTKLESTIKYLAVEVDDALELSDHTDI